MALDQVTHLASTGSRQRLVRFEVRDAYKRLDRASKNEIEKAVAYGDFTERCKYIRGGICGSNNRGSCRSLIGLPSPLLPQAC
jgi:hypothetical protein